MVSTTGGTRQVMAVGECDSTTHCRSPRATESCAELLELFWPAMCSKPPPLTVSSEPPPAEPAAGEMAVIAMTDWKVSEGGTAAYPKPGKSTRIGCIPGGALAATHARLTLPSPALGVAAQLHA